MPVLFRSICKPNLKCIASSAPEIWPGPQNVEMSHVALTTPTWRTRFKHYCNNFRTFSPYILDSASLWFEISLFSPKSEELRKFSRPLQLSWHCALHYVFSLVSSWCDHRFSWFFKMAAAAILDFQKFIILTVFVLHGAYIRHFAIFHQNRSNGGRDMAI